MGFMAFATPTVVTSATVTPFDEPPCYMRTQDGRVVNLQSLCSRPAPQQQPSAATSKPATRTSSPQAAPTQGNAPSRLRDFYRDHPLGNPEDNDSR